MFGVPSYTEMDRALRKEVAAMGSSGGSAMHISKQLPAGAMLDVDGRAYLAWQRAAYLWSPGGYTRARLTKEFGRERVLTPPSTFNVLVAGYRPWVHPSVMRSQPNV